MDDKHDAPHGLTGGASSSSGSAVGEGIGGGSAGGKAHMGEREHVPADHPPGPAENKPLPQGDVRADHAMTEEEPLGWDEAPKEGDRPPMQKRHSKTGGKGGTPDAGEDHRAGHD